jgi:phosphate transport system permease protein
MTERNDREARIAERLRRRHRAERCFRVLGLTAIAIGLGFLAVLFATVLNAGASAFQQTSIKLDFEIASPTPGDAEALARLDHQDLVKQALRETFPEVRKRREKRELYRLISPGAGFELRERLLAAPELAGSRLSIWLTAADEVPRAGSRPASTAPSSSTATRVSRSSPGSRSRWWVRYSASWSAWRCRSPWGC